MLLERHMRPLQQAPEVVPSVMFVSYEPPVQHPLQGTPLSLLNVEQDCNCALRFDGCVISHIERAARTVTLNRFIAGLMAIVLTGCIPEASYGSVFLGSN